MSASAILTVPAPARAIRWSTSKLDRAGSASAACANNNWCAANRLGFILSISLILVALFLKLGVKPRLALPIAVGTAFFIHVIFYKLLRVSLPWGVLPVLY